jgi:hypothetical protein
MYRNFLILIFFIHLWQIFEMYVGKFLFQISLFEDDQMRRDAHLAQMMQLAGVTEFPRSLLRRSKNIDEFFDQDGIISFCRNFSY